MAIFRGGKRVGPFDVRVGFPRDKSMDNIDSDPRLRQYANSENTIGRFRAAMAAAEGYARPARFAVRIFPPTNLESIVKSAQNTDTRAGGNFEQANTGASENTVNADMAQQVALMCTNISMPGRTFNTSPYRIAAAPYKFPTQVQYGDITASFIGDKFFVKSKEETYRKVVFYFLIFISIFGIFRVASNF